MLRLTALLLVLLFATPSPPRGVVRVSGTALADDNGPQNWLGGSLFWLAWAYKHDRRRLEQNLQWLSGYDFDYVRALGVVGGNAFWAARPVDPSWPDYAQVIARATDLAYDKWGLRVQWTIFGGTELAASPERRMDIVDAFAAMARGREHKIFLFEIANEAWQTGFSSTDPAELRSLGARLSSRTSVPVALTAPRVDQACAVYADSGADVATVHYPRSDAEHGPWQPLLQPWGWPDKFGSSCRGRLPKVLVNNEPIGIDSSVNEDDDPLRLALAYVTTFVSGNAAYVFHTGAGIRGGVFDGDDRRANMWEQPRADEAAAALSRLRRTLPHGLAAWKRYDASDPGAPFTDGAEREREGIILRLYAARDGRRFVAVVLDQRRPLTLTAAFPMVVRVVDPVSGGVYKTEKLSAGGKLTIEKTGGWLLVGKQV